MLPFAQRVVMNKIYTLLLMALALSLLTLWKSYEKKEKEPFCVTYHVAVHDTEERHEPIDRDYIIHPLSIWIEHPKKTILSAGDKCLQVALLASEIDKN